MLQNTTLHYYIGFIVALFIAVLALRKKPSTKLPYAPGPNGFPLIGNVLDIPVSSPWTKFKEWSHKYNSNVIHLRVIGSHILVLNSFETAVELFEKRSAIYSDKPRIPMLVELAKLDWSFVLFGYGTKWRSHRRLFHKYFGTNVISNFEPQERKATHELLRRLIHKPEDFMSHIRFTVASLILSIAYGIDVKSVDDPILVVVEKALEKVAIAGVSGSFLVDFLPILKYIPEWVPGAGFKRTAREWRKLFQDLADIPFQLVKNQMAKGLNRPCIVSSFLEGLGGNVDRETEDMIRGVSATIYGAASDTTVSSMCSFILAMVLHPEVAKKAQEELDRVVGQDRLPDFSDKPSLPYTCAVIKEVLRFYPVGPLGVRRLMVDDVYEDKFIPAGATVLGNIWAMLHDENVYKDPGAFNPERFLKDGELNPDVRPPEDIAFGFGRRSCAGKDFALSFIFLHATRILSVLDIGKAVDGDGNVITPNGEFNIGFICHPMPFKCSIKPRSQKALSIITERDDRP